MTWPPEPSGQPAATTEHATYRLVRYADDFVVMVAGTEAHAEELRGEVAAVLAPMGLRLSEHKTLTAHIDEGFEFLGFRIQRQRQQGSNRRYVYTWPSKKSLASIRAKVKAITRMGTNQPLSELLRRINQVLRGWTNYFRHGVSSRTFSHLHQFTWRTDRALAPTQTQPCHLEVAETALPGQQLVARARRCLTVQLRNSADHPLPLPRNEDPDTVGADQHRRLTIGTNPWRAGCGGSRTSGSGDGPEKPTSRNADRALRADLTWPTPNSTSAGGGFRTRRSGTGAASPTPCTGAAGCRPRRTSGSTKPATRNKLGCSRPATPGVRCR